MGKVKSRQAPLRRPAGKAAVPDRVEWLRAEMLKTRVAHGYCSRDLVADACPYANICEQCDNFVTAPEFTPANASKATNQLAVDTAGGGVSKNRTTWRGLLVDLDGVREST